MNETQPPFFIVGFPRSGTTLLRLMLTAHPGLVVAPESSFLTWLSSEFGDWAQGDAETARLDHYLNALVQARKFSTWGIRRSQLEEAIRMNTPADYSSLSSIPYELYASAQNKSSARWGDKNNVHLGMVPELARLFPQASFVHIVRDVRDVFASSQDVHALASTSPFKPNLTTDASMFADQWCAANQEAASALLHLPHTSIRYEDLVARPKATIGQVLDMLDLEWNDCILDYYLSPGLEPNETMDWKTLTRQPLTSAQVGRYQQALSQDDITLLTRAARPCLRSWGYL